MSKIYPMFSVIIPSYNNGETLGRAISSVLSQSYSAQEIIVIDDGSVDNSKEIVSEFGKAVRYIYQENAGVSEARNHGARVATGDWLAFLDADDIYLPDRLKYHADLIQREPMIDFLLGDQELRTPDDKFLRLTINASRCGKDLLQRHPRNKEIPILQEDFGVLIADGFAEIRTLSVPRRKFLSLGGFPIGKKIGEDLHFFIRLYANSKKGAVVVAPLAVYYIYSNSALRKDILAAHLAFVDAIDSLKNEEKNFPESIKKGIREKRRYARLSLAYALLKENRKVEAFFSTLPSFFAEPGIKTIKDSLSIVKGL